MFAVSSIVTKSSTFFRILWFAWVGVCRLRFYSYRGITRDFAAVAAAKHITKNMGIRMIYSIFKDISYQNMFGMNVLTIKI